MIRSNSKKSKTGKIVIYKTESGEVKIEAKIREETIWLSLNQIARLFNTDKSGISRHIGNIYKGKELHKDSTVAIFATVQKEGKREIERTIEHYNLDMIISVGYRVNSQKATQFRIWATRILRSYLIKGYVVNEKRLEELKKNIKKVKNRKNVILLGDSVSDTEMITGFEYDNLIKIGFLNEEIEKDLENYKENYDILILNDSSIEFINKLSQDLI